MKIGPFDIWPGPEGYIAVDEGDSYQLTATEMFQLGAAITQQAETMQARIEEEDEGSEDA